MTTSIITGDIIRSRTQTNPETWITNLKSALSFLNPDITFWDVYRGDSFQVELPNITESFMAATYIKACIKTISNLDVRLAIGIGNKTYQGNTVSESNGAAYVSSGETLDRLKKTKQNLAIKTGMAKLDKELNLYFRLVLIAMDKWTTNSAEIVKLSIEHPNALQSELGKLVGINQNAVSMRQKRAHLDDIKAVNDLFKEKIAPHFL